MDIIFLYIYMYVLYIYMHIFTYIYIYMLCKNNIIGHLCYNIAYKFLQVDENSFLSVGEKAKKVTKLQKHGTWSLKCVFL